MATALKRKNLEKKSTPVTTGQIKRAERAFEDGDYATAVKLFDKIVKKDPSNMGHARKYAISLSKAHKLTEALQVFLGILKTAPSSMIYYEMGYAYTDYLMLDDAQKAFEAAIRLDADNHAAWAGISICYFQQNKQEHAFLIMDKALSIALKTNAPEADISLYRHYISHFFLNTEIKKFDPVIKRLILEGLNYPFIPYDNYARPWVWILRTDPDLVPHLNKIHKKPFDEFKKQLNKPENRTLFTDPYFYTGIRKLHIIDRNIENLCRNFRHYFLDALEEDTLEEQHHELLYALAEQCFFNEYVLSPTEEEKNFTKAIENELATEKLSSVTNLPEKLAVLGCYKALFSLKNAKEILSFCQDKLNDHTLLNELLRVQIVEPFEEKDIQKKIKAIGSIQDEVSKKVREQYEENPYPRWKSGAKLSSKKHGLFSTPPIYNMPSENILTAGCGTGKQINHNRTLFPNAHITAIDITKSSLAYAIRKCKELEYDNIDFYHADILDIGQLGKKFDIIACTGVLHHMKDPFEGWKALESVLKPGGFMNIGLYSEIARQHIVKAREMIAEMGFEPTAEGIRACREHIKELPFGNPITRLLGSKDFYSLSGTRDLIFHVQEHRYTIQEIRETLDKLGLEFARMAIANSATKAHYHARFSDDEHFQSLNNIEIYEQENPHVFAGMYQFWVHKPKNKK